MTDCIDIPPRTASPPPAGSPYLHDRRETSFMLWELLRVHETLLDRPPFRGLDRAGVEALLDRAERHAGKLAATFTDSDRNPARRVDDDTVQVCDAFVPLWEEHLRDWFWMRRQAALDGADARHPVHAAHPVTQMTMEMFFGANSSFMPFSGFTPAAAALIRERGTDAQKATCLDRLDTVEWDACFCATEPDAGSDLTAVRTQAEPQGDGVYAIRGEKVFISAGMHALTRNTLYLVIGRLPGTQRSPLSLSCFIVPRYWPEADGRLVANHVACARIEDKMGLNGCPNAHLVFGDAAGAARGWLLGDQPNVALLQLRGLMSRARIETGIQGTAVASSAYLHAVRHARGRVQGVPFDKSANPWAAKVAIVQHRDVQRMLLDMKSRVEGCRILLARISTHVALEQASLHAADAGGDAQAQLDAAHHQRMVALYCPIAKAHVSEEAWHVVTQAIQVHGAVGYLRNRPLEQYLRDVKVLTIWEGTNYIQSQDLLRDKLGFGHDSLAMREFAADLRRTLARRDGFPDLHAEFDATTRALEALEGALAALGAQARAGRLLVVSQFCTRFLTMFGQVLVAWGLLEAACVASAQLPALAPDHADRAFYAGKLSSARFYIRNVLPAVHLAATLVHGAQDCYIEADPREFGSARSL